MKCGPLLLVAANVAAPALTERLAVADDRPGVVLRYSAEADCPDESSFRNLVAARLGYSPFATQGLDRVEVTITSDGGHLRGRASVQRSQSAATSAREIPGERHECEAIVAALATTVAIALDPVGAMTVRPVSPPPAPPPDVPTPAEIPLPPATPPVRDVPAVASPPPPRERLRFVAVAAGVASVAAAPSVTLGGEAGVAVARGRFSMGLLARVEATPTAVQVQSGDHLEATLVSASLVPCGHVGGFHACAFGRIGAFQGDASDVAHPSVQSSFFAAAGGRVGYTLQITRVVALEGNVDVGFPLVRTALSVNGAAVWTAPPVMGALSLGIAVRLL